MHVLARSVCARRAREMYPGAREVHATQGAHIAPFVVDRGLGRRATGRDDVPLGKQRDDLRVDLLGVGDAWQGGGRGCRRRRRGAWHGLDFQERAFVFLLAKERELIRLGGELEDAGKVHELEDSLDDGRARLAVHARVRAPGHGALALRGERRLSERHELCDKSGCSRVATGRMATGRMAENSRDTIAILTTNECPTNHRGSTP